MDGRMERLCADSACGGDSWAAAALRLQSRTLHTLKKARCALKACYKHNKRLSLHLPAFVLVPFPLHFGQDVVQRSYLRGDGVNLDPDSIRVHPGHSRAGQTLRTGPKLAGVVVGPDGAWEEAWRRVGGGPLGCGGGVEEGLRAQARGVYTGGGLADGDGWVTGVCLG